MALAVYLKLATHTRSQVDQLETDKAVFYSQFIDFEDSWANCKKMLQGGEDLGERMKNAFKDSFQNGYHSVCIIGTDCADLKTCHLVEAFECLKSSDLVVGPAKDGGYYLLGMNQLHAELFRNKKWSTSSVCRDTLKDAANLRLSVSILEELSDVDEIGDVPPQWKL